MSDRVDPYRAPSVRRAYTKYLQQLGPNEPCQFCVINAQHVQFVEETEHFKIIKNQFPYAIWDTVPVAEHLMIAPKAHVDSLKELTAEQSKEFIDILGRYEEHGYSIYARALSHLNRSVVHQHTHLIKTEKRRHKRSFISSPSLFRIAR